MARRTVISTRRRCGARKAMQAYRQGSGRQHAGWRFGLRPAALPLVKRDSFSEESLTRQRSAFDNAGIAWRRCLTSLEKPSATQFVRAGLGIR